MPTRLNNGEGRANGEAIDASLEDRPGVRALLATRDVAAKRRRTAALDRRHHLGLAEGDMAGVGLTPCRTMVAEDIRDLQRRTRHPAKTIDCKVKPGNDG